MNIKVSYFDNKIELNKENINAIEIENKSYFYRFISDLKKIVNDGYTEDVKFFNNEFKELNMNNKIKVFVDFFNLGFDSKKCTNDITKYVNNNKEEDARLDLIKQYNNLVKSYKNILDTTDIPLKIDDEVSIDNISKILKLGVNNKNELLNDLLLLIDLEKNLQTYNILVFVNLKQYLTKEEIIELYKYSIYNEIKIILVDSQSYGVTYEYEKKLIIDSNLDEFML